jgi:hypothetical protein
MVAKNNTMTETNIMYCEGEGKGSRPHSKQVSVTASVGEGYQMVLLSRL